MTTTTKTANLGSVSSGTMRAEDLLPAFLDVLEGLDPERAREFKLEAFSDLTVANSAEFDEVRSDIVNDLSDVLSEYAPPYAYFGSHEGDGALYGYWVDFDNLEEDARNEDGVIKVNAGDDFDEPADEADVDMVMAVTDHGNVTLYKRDDDRKWHVVWSIV